MNPRLMLSLWRERWGKAAGTSFKVPYVHGKLNQWTRWLPHCGVWSIAGVSAFSMLSCALLMLLVTNIGLSFNGQVVFSFLFVCIAVYVRRYTGTLITLVLTAMSVIASTRYLYWRFDATLVPDFSLNFLFGFYFFVAECYLALFVFAGLVQSIWPLKRASVALPSDQDQWPTVDVFILCDDQPYAAIKLTAVASAKLEWPRKKLKIYLIDGTQRDDLYALAASVGAHYLPHPGLSNCHADLVNLSLPSTSGEFLIIFESGQAPDHRFLASTVGWFIRDQKLALIQTPHHFLAPGPSRDHLGLTNASESVALCALVRRSVVVRMGGVDAAAATPESHMALTLQASGYGNAYVGFSGNEKWPNKNHAQNAVSESASDTAPELFLVEYPFASRSLLWKQRIVSLRRALQFYYSIPRLLFSIAPVLYLLGHIQLIQTSSQSLMAYAIPHFLHAYIAHTRTDEKKRFKLFTDIRETALAWYLLIPTMLSLLQTQFKQCFLLWTDQKPKSAKKSDKPFDADTPILFSPAKFLPYLLVLSLNLAGFFAGLFDIFTVGTSQQGLEVFYLLWTTYNLMLLAATLAVAQEASQVLKHIDSQKRLTAMIKLPSGRTLSCVTENFPAPKLQLSLPMSVAVGTDVPVSLSIFHAHRELTLSATVLVQQDLRLDVYIADANQKDYQLFATSVLSRGQDWPKWLPGYSADRPLPKWITDSLISVSIAVLDFVTNINKYLHWARLDSWIQLWRKKK